MARRLALGLVAVTLAASGCSHGAASVPRAVPLPRIAPSDPPQIRAAKLASYIERRWPRIFVDSVEADRSGSLVQFLDRAGYDYSIKDLDRYETHVRDLTSDLTQASVELLKLSLRYFPRLQFASVWQDSQLKAYWSKEGIEAMARPEAYRNYQSFLKLIMTAQLPPLGIHPPPAPTS